MIMAESAVPGFEVEQFTALGETRDVYRRGEGPGIVLMHEVPGITEHVSAFGERLADEGFTVLMPQLFGTPGRPFSGGYSVASILRCCIAKEFHVLASHGASPITDWLRELCRHAHEELGGPGVGAVGLCMTGNFALALAVEPCLMAPVLGQPSLPFALTPGRRAGVHCSPDALAQIRRRADEQGLEVLGMRFTHDQMVPRARFDTLRRELGDAFVAIEIDSGPGNAHGVPVSAHSVLSHDFVDQEGHPTRVAFEQTVAFFRDKLVA
jgi:dienelactone hydrolase